MTLPEPSPIAGCGNEHIQVQTMDNGDRLLCIDEDWIIVPRRIVPWVRESLRQIDQTREDRPAEIRIMPEKVSGLTTAWCGDGSVVLMIGGGETPRTLLVPTLWVGVVGRAL